MRFARTSTISGDSTFKAMIKKVEDQEEDGHKSFPNSSRVYLEGSRPDVAVPMREISLSPSSLPDGSSEPNEPVRVYDTSGPWGDPDFHGDHVRGLPVLRAGWIRERGDVEEVEGRAVQPMDNGYLSEKHADRTDERTVADSTVRGSPSCGLGRERSSPSSTTRGRGS